MAPGLIGVVPDRNPKTVQRGTVQRNLNTGRGKVETTTGTTSSMPAGSSASNAYEYITDMQRARGVQVPKRPSRWSAPDQSKIASISDWLR
jgi:hypothetical protein